jgi:hypothetical protein
MQSLHAQLRQREAEARQRDAELKRNVAFLGTLRALTSASFCRYCATKRSEAKESAVCHSANRYVNHWGQYDPHHRQAKEHEWALPVTKEVLDHEFMIPPPCDSIAQFQQRCFKPIALKLAREKKTIHQQHARRA